MGKCAALFHRIGLHHIFGMVLALSGVMIVFSPVISRYSGLIAPDSMPFFAYPWRTSHFETMLASGSFTPQNLYWLLLHPLYAHELTYIIDSLVLTFGAVYYLRTQRLHPLAAWFGGLALGLCGYTFTLFSAGHRGYFHMFSCAVWAFGLIARGFETRKLFYFAMLGLVFAWGVPYQPDVLLLVGALASAYVLWLTGRDRSRKSEVGSQRSEEVGQEMGDGGRETGDVSRESRVIKAATGRSGYWKTALHVWPRFGVSALVLVLAGFGGIRAALTTQIANRDAQIAGVTGKVEKADGKSVKMTDAQKRERWLFATNWSLPPEDVLEFIVPGVYGNDSGQPPYPYWGRLGRPHHSVFQKGRMMPNYRQHTVYLGLVPLLFALFAVFAWFSYRRTKEPLPNHASASFPFSIHPSSFTPQNYSDVPFWCGVWVVCLLLAFGRYTPLYRLFYALPYMDYIRAPVKFLHLVEIATAFLAGMGMEVFMRAERDALRRKLLWLAVSITALLLLGSLVVLTARPAIVRHIAELGMAQLADALGGYAVRNFVRSTGLAMLIAGALWAVVGRCQSERARLVLGGCLMVVLCLDQAEVASRYVRAMDLGPLYRENAVVKAIKKQAGGQLANVVNYATQNATGRDWFSSSLAFNGIRNLAPSQDEIGQPYGRIFLGMQKEPLRLWKLLGAQTVIVPLKGSEGLLRAGVLQPLLNFELGAGTVRQVQQPGDKTLVLAALPRAEKGLRFLVDWQGDVPVERQAEVLVKGQRSVSDAPCLAGCKLVSGGQVETLTERGLPGALATRVRVKTDGPGLLVFNERADDRQEVLVDGKVASGYVADAVWRAVLVPSGEHEVLLRHHRKTAELILSILTALAIFTWALAVNFLHKKPEFAGVSA